MPVVKQVTEVWKNVAAGLRWYKALDVMGREITAIVQPGRTFTLSPLERQLNQQIAASAKLDHFKNGNFIMIKESEETDPDEISSVNSVTDAALELLIRQMLEGDPIPLEALLERIDSVETAQRIFEELVLCDARSSLVDIAREKVALYTERPTVPINRLENLQIPGAPTRGKAGDDPKAPTA